MNDLAFNDPWWLILLKVIGIFAMLVLLLIATAVVVTVAMFETLYIVMG